MLSNEPAYSAAFFITPEMTMRYSYDILLEYYEFFNALEKISKNVSKILQSSISS